MGKLLPCIGRCGAVLPSGTFTCGSCDAAGADLDGGALSPQQPTKKAPRLSSTLAEARRQRNAAEQHAVAPEAAPRAPSARTAVPNSTVAAAAPAGAAPQAPRAVTIQGPVRNPAVDALQQRKRSHAEASTSGLDFARAREDRYEELLALDSSVSCCNVATNPGTGVRVFAIAAEASAAIDVSAACQCSLRAACSTSALLPVD